MTVEAILDEIRALSPVERKRHLELAVDAFVELGLPTPHRKRMVGVGRGDAVSQK